MQSVMGIFRQLTVDGWVSGDPVLVSLDTDMVVSLLGELVVDETKCNGTRPLSSW
jgi:hypothetical protein